MIQSFKDLILSASVDFFTSRVGWLEFGLLNQTCAKVRDLYFQKALSLECLKMRLGNLRISISVHSGRVQ